MKAKVFIDGSEGTTGLRINERFQGRDDIELLHISPECRKDPEERKKLINASDITFLCLPDEAAREAVSLTENENVILIDTSTAHRTQEGWAYGFPELSDAHKTAIKTEKRIAVPGCYATGFISLVYPLIAEGILSKDYPVSSFAISGYSGAGKKAIAAYESKDRPKELSAGREYALTQKHKHLKEMQKITGLSRTPLFSPIIDDYYSGMVVSVPLYTDMLSKKQTPESLLNFYAAYYQNRQFIQVSAADDEIAASGFLAGNALSGWDGLKIYVTGNEERVVISSQFDNLGKGASGAAIQCMNLILGCDEAKGLDLNRA
ncbi:MAG: N-acetyl-gamma-glutamyl-phosphate reductase [Lachnospiraceae bacterium]|nr:N-acetyl-gamma-glutamyl-phosphate reductase [Lachnospiraceae bacterium]